MLISESLDYALMGRRAQGMNRACKNLLAIWVILALASRVTNGPTSGTAATQPPPANCELFHQTPQPLVVLDYESLRLIAVNQTALEAYGYSEAEFKGMSVVELAAAEQREAWTEALRAAKQSPDLEPHWRHRKKDGTLMEVEIVLRNLCYRGHPSGLLLCADITERRRTELQTTAFSELSRRLSAARTPKDAARIIMAAAEVLFGWDACVFELCAGDGTKLRTLLCMDTLEGRKTDVTQDALPTTPGAHAREALEQGARLILRQQLDGFPPDMHPFGDKTRPSASLMFAPIRKEREAIGVLSIQSYRQNAYNENDLRSLQGLADHCASALERIRAEEEVSRLNAELEMRVKERTAQLEAINKELEAFSYSVSHDLRAPLRSIMGFSEVLLERHAQQLDVRGREFLRRACESSQQMDRLIESLLKLSRIGRAEVQRQQVDLTRLAGMLIDELRQSEPERQVTARVAPGLQVFADERLMRIVLENLLRNAWKFTSKRSDSVVEVGFDAAKAAYFVRDNGAGFDMAYARTLFGVFQRLHSSSEFPGHGVGLATVQRIINRHGGRVWADAAVGKGATFYFSVPSDANT